jgi:hypothetical protein
LIATAKKASNYEVKVNKFAMATSVIKINTVTIVIKASMAAKATKVTMVNLGYITLGQGRLCQVMKGSVGKARQCLVTRGWADWSRLGCAFK